MAEKPLLYEWALNDNNSDIYEIIRYNYDDLFISGHIIHFPAGNRFMCAVWPSKGHRGFYNMLPTLFESVLWCDTKLMDHKLQLKDPLAYPLELNILI